MEGHRRHSVIGWSIAAVAIAVLLAFGWQRYGGAKAPPSGGGASAPAAVAVTTARAERRDFPITLEANGSVVPLNSVDVRAQVASIVTKVLIKEGQFVKAGEPMFQLDARTDEAAVNRARAQLAKDEATLADAQRQLARSQDLLRQGFISQSAVDTNQSQVDAQRSAVTADKAAIASAQVGLGFTRIEAPSAGRVGAINVFPGSYVQPGTTPLVTITQLDPIAVAFNLPQRHLPDALARLASGGIDVVAVLPNVAGPQGQLRGKLQFVDNVIDPNSGTVKVKATFANPQHLLWPGAYVNVRFGVETLKDAVVVPQTAIVQGAKGTSVYVVQADGKAAQREVEVRHGAGPQAVVSGLDGGERVVVEGKQNLRPGTPVTEAPAQRAPAASGASGGTGAAPGTAPARAPQP